MALFDVVVNNADRKGGHVLPMADGHRYGVDHGLTFHVEHKLRTVLWGFVGERSPRRRPPACGGSRRALDGELGATLAGPADRRRGRDDRRGSAAGAASRPALRVPRRPGLRDGVTRGTSRAWPASQ